MHADWFYCTSGVRQGDALSRTFLIISIYDLVLGIKDLGRGIPVHDMLIAILLYADDIVMLAETEYDYRLC